MTRGAAPRAVACKCRHTTELEIAPIHICLAWTEWSSPQGLATRIFAGNP
jgi:hypothetical protein